jgi:hypothetical protein
MTDCWCVMPTATRSPAPRTGFTWTILILGYIHVRFLNSGAAKRTYALWVDPTWWKDRPDLVSEYTLRGRNCRTERYYALWAAKVGVLTAFNILYHNSVRTGEEAGFSKIRVNQISLHSELAGETRYSLQNLDNIVTHLSNYRWELDS